MPEFHYHPDTDVGIDLSALLQRRIATQPDSVAITDQKGTSLSYHEFDAYTRNVAARLAAGETAIRAGDKVAMLARNGAGFAILYYAILRLGATVVPINTLLKAGEIVWIVEDSGASMFLFDAEFAGLVDECLERQTQQFGHSVNHLEISPALWLDAFAPPDVPVLEMPPSIDAENDVAVIIYTSGTTGTPKGAMLTHRNLAVNTWSGSQVFALRPGEDRILVVLPMFHSFAGTIGMHMSLLYGCTMLPLPRFEPNEVANAIARLEATIFLGVPSMYNLLLRQPEAMRGRLASLRLCVSGGAALPVAILQGFEQRYGVVVLEGDGPTECSPLTCMNPLEGPRKPGTVGPPVPGVEMSVRDEQGNRVADNMVGEICVRGPNIMKGYLNRPDETACSFFGDWFRTGDLGLRDEDGWFSIVDRLKDMIIVNGMNVYPRMIEEVLYRHPAIIEAAVVGEPHDLHGEIVVAWVVSNDDTPAQKIRQWCREQLGPHQAPRRIELIEALPKGATGKILKRELRKHGEIERGVQPSHDR